MFRYRNKNFAPGMPFISNFNLPLLCQWWISLAVKFLLVELSVLIGVMEGIFNLMKHCQDQREMMSYHYSTLPLHFATL